MAENENTKIETDLDDEELLEKIKKKKLQKRKNIFFIILAVLIMAGVGYAYYYYMDANTYFKTDNAKVSVQLYNITPTAPGKLVKFTVSEGSKVSENEIIGRVENGSYLRAPISGEVLKSDVTLNQLVAPTTVVAVIGDTDNIYIGVNIEETDITKIQLNQEVKVDLDAYPGKTFKGFVSEITPVTQNALSGNMTSFSTSGTYTKTTQLLPIKVKISEDVKLNGIIGTNATVKIKIK